MWMELSIRFLQCMMRDDQKQEHVECNAMMSQIGPYLGDDYLYLVLYRSYAIVFEHLMNSTIVQVARSYGFWPIFCMKNALIQTNMNQTWGVNRSRIVTCDKEAKSFLTIIGFWRQNSPNPNDTTLLSMSSAGKPLTSLAGTQTNIQEIVEQEKAAIQDV